jgi:hypothetical protein
MILLPPTSLTFEAFSAEMRKLRVQRRRARLTGTGELLQI